ncbi:unnamed protein product [Spirodela intermedia]|uniref:Glyoxalase/fosfomycin resistance/dioxygenase domain-containing protein n=1 Tax=Spirodela intermedia TaxID=51605 RepID=A0A7I8JBV9_SPIIN|nr:unnamed protein product [Spirodela intermedia]CAA6667686.1 unnamed protein product [Spirodela intermedia]
MGREIREEEPARMPTMVLNHVSFVVQSVSRSVSFYEGVLGFTSIKRPSSFLFKDAWLLSNGLGIHLLESTEPEKLPRKKKKINPKENHISFQTSDMELTLFFHDPDGYMVEICNCHVLPVLPLPRSPVGSAALSSPQLKKKYIYITIFSRTINVPSEEH